MRREALARPLDDRTEPGGIVKPWGALIGEQWGQGAGRSTLTVLSAEVQILEKQRAQERHETGERGRPMAGSGRSAGSGGVRSAEWKGIRTLWRSFEGGDVEGVEG